MLIIQTKFSLLVLTWLIWFGFDYSANPVRSQALEQLKPAVSSKMVMQPQSVGFDENKGQVKQVDGADAPYVSYYLQEGNTNIYLHRQGGISWQFNRLSFLEEKEDLVEIFSLDELRSSKRRKTLKSNSQLETYRMDMYLLGANPNAQIISSGRSVDFTNFYTCNALEVFKFDKVVYRNIYPGIDWEVYTNEHGLKYDFVVHPGANPATIQLSFVHHEELYLDDSGNLVHGNRMGCFKEFAPVSFQGDTIISTRFVLEGRKLRFELDTFNPTLPLVIDPARIWATYYGGSATEFGTSCAVDESGNIFLTGHTTSTLAIASGGHQLSLGGNRDAFVTKFNSSGVRQWATYYGGNEEDYAWDCVVDKNGNVYIAGATKSVSSITEAGHQTTLEGHHDAFLVKFDNNGTRLWGTYYGGEGEDWGYSCAVDGSGNIFLSGDTWSTYNIAEGGHQNELGGGWDAFMVKFDSNGVLIWGTYYGGEYDDTGWSCATDKSDNVYLAGETKSNYGIAWWGNNDSHSGERDGFLVKFNSAGIRNWATYFGGSEDDIGYSCAVDKSGNVYLAGATGSESVISWGGHQYNYGGGYDAFLVKYSTYGEMLWGTFYGGDSWDVGYDCATDGAENIYLSGWTASSNAIASGGHQNTNSGGWDAYIAKFDNNGVRQWASYYGGSDFDEGVACVVDGSGYAYLAGTTSSENNIGWAGHQIENGGEYDAFLVKFEGCTPSSAAVTMIGCDSYSINGQVYTISGNYTQTLTNKSGCDSTLTLTLALNYTTTNSVDLTECDSLIYNEISYVSSGSYTQILTNEQGCDSILTLNIIINKVSDISTALSGETITAINTGAVYQWVDCNNGNAIIPGETNQTFIATSNGNYAVQLMENGCVAISECVEVSTVSVSSFDYSRQIVIAPNPTDGIFRLKYPKELHDNIIFLYNPFGQVMDTRILKNEFIDFNLTNLPAGMYFIIVQSHTGIIVNKVLKQ